ncbi:MAG: relaxase/mobilization nuclease domain-containing protein [Clostridia bacterium]|nr:relaxase/mobilization nuclease domain-containing protein [Clostridia bacterium]
MQNPRISNPAGHITLSFSADDKPKLSDEKMLKIALDYIKMMGLDKTQFIVVRHYETDKPHCHIVFNMVGDNGKRMESGRNRYKNQKVCEAFTASPYPSRKHPTWRNFTVLNEPKRRLKLPLRRLCATPATGTLSPLCWLRSISTSYRSIVAAHRKCRAFRSSWATTR